MGVDWTTVDTHHIYDCLNVYTCHSLSPPSYFTTDLIDRIRADTEYLETQHFSFNNTAQKAVGPLMQDSWGAMKAVINGTSQLKMWFISGHDSAPMIQLLGKHHSKPQIYYFEPHPMQLRSVYTIIRGCLTPPWQFWSCTARGMCTGCAWYTMGR